MTETEFIQIAKCLADPTRHQILQRIRAAGELNCSQVRSCFELSQPTISHHVKTMAQAGLIKVREEGAYHVLSVNEDILRAFADQLTMPQSARA